MNISQGTAPGQYISATATDPIGDTSEFCLDVITQGQINLVVSGTASPSTVPAGGDVTYALNIANQGNIDAHQVNLSDLLPPGVTVVSATFSQGYLSSAPPTGPIVASLGTLPAGASATATIVVQTGAASVGTITDTATVSSEEFDPTPPDETVSLTSTVLSASDLAIALGGTPNSVLAGEDATFVMTVSNLGPDTANGVTAAFPLGPAFTYVSATSNVGSVSYANGAVGFALADLAANSEATVTVVAQAVAVGAQTETAIVSSLADDPNPANNTATTTIQVDPASDLAVSITSSSSPVAPTIGFSYDVNVVNNGPSVGISILLSDTLPTGVTFVSATSDVGVTPTESDGVVSLSLSSWR